MAFSNLNNNGGGGAAAAEEDREEEEIMGLTSPSSSSSPAAAPGSPYVRRAQQLTSAADEKPLQQQYHLSRILDGPVEAAEAAAAETSAAFRGSRGVEDDEDDEAAASASRSVAKRFSALTEEHIAILSSFNQQQLLRVVDQLSEKQRPLDSVLDSVAADVVSSVRKVAEQQRRADSQTDAETDKAIAAAAAAAAGAPPPTGLLRGLSSSCPGDALPHDYYFHVARFVPLRLTFEERIFFRLLESTLEVSEYTDRIDILCGGNRARRMAREIRQVCAVLSGLALAHNYEDGQRLVRDHDFVSNSAFFQTVFEVGRRYKILNPERMRSAYGKLIYLLMDAKKPEVQQLLQFDCVIPVHTVYSHLAGKRRGLDLLRDPLVRVATMEIMPEGKSRHHIQREIKEKQNAIKTLARKYAGRDSQKSSQGFFGLRLSFFQRQDSCCGHAEDEAGNSLGRLPAAARDNDASSDLLTVEEIEQCLYSLGDHNSYLRFNREPCDRMISFLRQYFDPAEPEEGYSLAISSGCAGARLTHSHSRQFVFVLQSLTLWREVCSEMFVLWQMAEADMLQSGNVYRLRDTGQGLNRKKRGTRSWVKQHLRMQRDVLVDARSKCAAEGTVVDVKQGYIWDCPRVSRAMHAILERVQRLTTQWVGSAVVHLGDHNVPNALMFIDKYTQVPRILAPIVLCLEKLPELYESKPAMRNYFDNQFGGLHALRKRILCDFFRHAFDGSGADNFFDAGSCIDGRLTSAWNWCSTIERKSFFPAFLLTGFQGFDGKF